MDSNNKFKKQTSIFISSTTADEKFKYELLKQLQSIWKDELVFIGDHYWIDDLVFLGERNAGQEWETSLTREFAIKADVVVVLLSIPYLEIITKVSKKNSDNRETSPSANAFLDFFKVLSSGGKRVVPILVEECEWEQSPFADFIVLPFSKTPFSKAKNRQEPFEDLIYAFYSIFELLENYNAGEALSRAKENQSEEVTLTGLGLKYVPFDLLGLTNTTYLWLEKNNIEKINHLDALTNLVHLSLENNKIGKIENLEALSKLKELNLTSNEISELDNLEALISLTRLELRYNKLSTVQNLKQLKQLEVLGISNNQITSLDGVETLKSLQILYASHNKIRQIDELVGLKNLRRIVLTNNQIQSIKPMLEHIRKGLFVSYSYDFNENNPGLFVKDNTSLSEPYVEVIQRGRDAILKYFADADEYGVQKLELVKMILVGNSRVGKTNLSQFLRTGIIDPKTNSTHLLDIQPWDAPFLKSENDTLTRVAIFDFGGQDYYHDSHRLYYSHDTAYLLLWEPSSNKYKKIEETNPETGEKLIFENFPIEYWLESILYNLKGKSQSEFKNDKGQKQNGNSKKTVPVLVLQNKIDLGEGMLDQDAMKTKYPMVWGFFGVSLSSEKRTKILDEVLSDYFWALDLSGRKLVNFEMKVIQHFLENQGRLEILSLDDFWTRCVGIIGDPNIQFNKDNAQIIAQILSNSGLILFESMGEGKGWVYTNIKQLNELVKQVMEVARAGNDQGIFTKQQILSISEHEAITGLLVRNNSIIKINQEEYLAPQFLPTEPDKFIRFFLPGFAHTHIRFVYRAFFHKMLMLNLFSKYLENENIDTTMGVRNFPFWRNGIIVRRENPETSTIEMVFVEFLKTEDFGIINIRTQDPFNRNGLEQDIVKTLDELNQHWTYEKQMSSDSIHYFSVEKVKKEVENRQYSFTHTLGLDNTDLKVWEAWKSRNTSQSETIPPQRVFSVFDFKHLEDFGKLPKKLFISYSSKNSAFVKRFVTHLEVLKANGTIHPWFDRMIESGTRWEDAIQEEMNRADLIVFMLSPDFLATEYVMKTEVPMAIKRFPTGNKFLFVNLLDCGWRETVINQFQQTDDSKKENKDLIVVGTPENDTEWMRIMGELIEKLKVV